MTPEFNKLLQTNSPSLKMMAYDTMFQLGVFYVLPLLFCHTVLDGSPVLSLGFLIHECKFKKMQEFFQQVKKEVPYFYSDEYTPIPLVTDDERALYEAAEKVLKNVSPFQC